MSLEDDYGDFYLMFKQVVCRGNRLNNALKELREGIPPSEQGVVTGFSKNPLACKRFASRVIGQNGQTQGPPTIIIANEEDVREKNPTLVEVKYTEEWLREHPDVLDALLTIPMPNATFKEKYDSVRTFKDEQEIVIPGTQKAEIPSDIKINVYIGPKELEEMGQSPMTMGLTHPSFVKAVDKVVPSIKERIKKEIPSGVDATVKIYSCHDTLNLFEVDRSACALHDVFYVERGEKL